ncbi:hypothetical protein GLP21_09805 [Photobacterium carnosum]|uniref:hypothetical protein n=1 Tax=Photobacterium aquimaris TaxID=512643 RepID=UPI001181A9A4|nr:hypothetical protein [Photobacterium aquimaris]MCD9548925.1 hypothetical protein [Photobacterium carnosum]MCF2305863.1 hypothetical protein [Photobacterium carnosum]
MKESRLETDINIKLNKRLNNSNNNKKIKFITSSRYNDIFLLSNTLSVIDILRSVIFFSDADANIVKQVIEKPINIAKQFTIRDAMSFNSETLMFS